MQRATHGWVKDKIDERDYRFSAKSAIRLLPAKVELRGDRKRSWPPVYDQGSIGACVGNAVAAAIEYDRAKQKMAIFTPSRLFIYYYARMLEGTISEDAGCEIRDGVKVSAQYGAPPEIVWPYTEKKFAELPSVAAQKAAIHDRALEYRRVDQTLESLKACLTDGFPFIFGFKTFENFHADKVERTGVLELPKANDSRSGAHAVLCVGYDNAKGGRFVIRNSWGWKFGVQGYFTMPYDYVCNPDLSDDFWVIKKIES